MEGPQLNSSPRENGAFGTEKKVFSIITADVESVLAETFLITTSNADSDPPAHDANQTFDDEHSNCLPKQQVDKEAYYSNEEKNARKENCDDNDEEVGDPGKNPLLDFLFGEPKRQSDKAFYAECKEREGSEFTSYMSSRKKRLYGGSHEEQGGNTNAWSSLGKKQHVSNKDVYLVENITHCSSKTGGDEVVLKAGKLETIIKENEDIGAAAKDQQTPLSYCTSGKAESVLPPASCPSSSDAAAIGNAPPDDILLRLPNADKKGDETGAFASCSIEPKEERSVVAAKIVPVQQHHSAVVASGRKRLKNVPSMKPPKTRILDESPQLEDRHLADFHQPPIGSTLSFDWLEVKGPFRFAGGSEVSPDPTSNKRPKYKLLRCLICAEYSPTSCWSQLRYRLVDRGVCQSHEKSRLHVMASSAKTMQNSSAARVLTGQSNHSHPFLSIFSSGGGAKRFVASTAHQEPLYFSSTSSEAGVSHKGTSGLLVHHDHSNILPPFPPGAGLQSFMQGLVMPNRAAASANHHSCLVPISQGGPPPTAGAGSAQVVRFGGVHAPAVGAANYLSSAERTLLSFPSTTRPAPSSSGFHMGMQDPLFPPSNASTMITTPASAAAAAPHPPSLSSLLGGFHHEEQVPPLPWTSSTGSNRPYHHRVEGDGAATISWPRPLAQHASPAVVEPSFDIVVDTVSRPDQRQTPKFMMPPL